MDVDLANMAAARRVRVLTEEPRMAQLAIGAMVKMLRDAWDAKLEGGGGGVTMAALDAIGLEARLGDKPQVEQPPPQPA